MKKGTVLSIDDDSGLQTVIQQYLEEDGYNVMTASSVATAMEKTDMGMIDVILLDLNLPDGEGLSLIPQFHAKSSAAIIVVSGKTETTEKIICLEMGADDYMTKPFEMRELSARIKAVLRRGTNNNATKTPAENAGSSLKEKEKIEFSDGWILDRTQFQLFTPEGKSADFTTGEFKLLEALVLSSNRALSRQHLFDLTRDGRFDVYDRSIDIQVARLRKKLGDDNNNVIKTVRGVGYMFCGTISA